MTSIYQLSERCGTEADAMSRIGSQHLVGQLSLPQMEGIEEVHGPGKLWLAGSSWVEIIQIWGTCCCRVTVYKNSFGDIHDNEL